MNTLRQRFWTSLTPLAPVFALGIAGCGGGEEAPADSPGQPGETAEAVEVANPATLQGRVAFEGDAPELTAIDMRDEPSCMEQHADGPRQEEVLVSDGGLQNVFVYVKQGLEGQSFPSSGGEALIDQAGCMYQPRVLGVQTGQDIIIKNSDGLLHNVNASPSQNRGFNFSQPTSMEGTRSFNTAEVMIPVRCDVHGWMTAYIGVLDHPYHAVSGEDGSFDISNLPPGDYVVEAWHERYGVQEMNVSVGPDETAEVNFTYNAQMAGNPVPMGEPVELHAHHTQP